MFFCEGDEVGEVNGDVAGGTVRSIKSLADFLIALLPDIPDTEGECLLKRPTLCRELVPPLTFAIAGRVTPITILNSEQEACKPFAACFEPCLKQTFQLHANRYKDRQSLNRAKR